MDLNLMKLMSDNRWCYVVLETQFDKNGYIPSLVIESVKGHFQMTGQGKGASPWYWGKTFKEASGVCEAQNEKMGISKIEASKIVASTM